MDHIFDRQTVSEPSIVLSVVCGGFREQTRLRCTDSGLLVAR
jgi:hypothetical protein